MQENINGLQTSSLSNFGTGAIYQRSKDPSGQRSVSAEKFSLQTRATIRALVWPFPACGNPGTSCLF